MFLQMYVSNELIHFFLFWRKWLGLKIAGISQKTLLDEIEYKVKKVVENAKPAYFDWTANDNNEDNKNEGD